MRSESRLHGCWNASWRFRNIRCQTVVSPKKYGKTTWFSELNLQIWGAHHFRRNPDKDWSAITKCWSCWSIIYAYLWYNYIRALGIILTMSLYVYIYIYIYIHTVYIYIYIYLYIYIYILYIYMYIYIYVYTWVANQTAWCSHFKEATRAPTGFCSFLARSRSNGPG